MIPGQFYAIYEPIKRKQKISTVATRQFSTEDSIEMPLVTTETDDEVQFSAMEEDYSPPATPLFVWKHCATSSEESENDDFDEHQHDEFYKTVNNNRMNDEFVVSPGYQYRIYEVLWVEWKRNEFMRELNMRITENGQLLPIRHL